MLNQYPMIMHTVPYPHTLKRCTALFPKKSKARTTFTISQNHQHSYIRTTTEDHALLYNVQHILKQQQQQQQQQWEEQQRQQRQRQRLVLIRPNSNNISSSSSSISISSSSNEEQKQQQQQKKQKTIT